MIIYPIFTVLSLIFPDTRHYRCILFQCFDIKDALVGQKYGNLNSVDPKSICVGAHLMSEDQKLQTPREKRRVKTGAPIEWHCLPTDASAIYLPEYLRSNPPSGFAPSQSMAAGMDSLDISISRGRRISAPAIRDISSDGNSAIVNSFLFTVNASNGRNGSSRSQLDMVTDDTMHSKSDGVSDKGTFELQKLPKVYFIFDWGYPEATLETAAETIIQSLVGPEGDLNLHRFEPELCPDFRGYMNVAFQESFIQKRILKVDGGEVEGPEALFSRFNTSILMTRSIGDRFGPRRCLPIPEISAITIPDGKHARAIIASDGFWDVVTVETTRRIVMNTKYKDGLVTARELAMKARRRRERMGIHFDDITVMVVDINPDCFVGVSGMSGGTRPSGKGCSLM